MAAIEQTTPSTGRVGRPRANPRPIEQPPEEEILAVAGRLFALKGFAGTSTREIAEGAGLRQPSLFHYYAKKEKILEALLARISRSTGSYGEQIEALAAPATGRLYRLIYFEVHSICASPYPVAAIASLPEVRAPRFPEFWAAQRARTALYRDLIQGGIDEGELAPIDAALCALALQGMSAGALRWHWKCAERSPEEIADLVAGLELRSLLRDPSQVERVRSEAHALQLEP